MSEYVKCTNRMNFNLYMHAVDAALRMMIHANIVTRAHYTYYVSSMDCVHLTMTLIGAYSLTVLKTNINVANI